MLRCALVLTLLLGSLPTLALAEEVTDEGRKAFKRCSSCHAISGENGGGFGPRLDDVYGQPVGRLDGYRYSKQMQQAREAGMTWDDATLDAYIENPRKVIRSPLKSIPGIRDAGVRTALISFLKAKSSP
jgi:cytochrome c2